MSLRYHLPRDKITDTLAEVSPQFSLGMRGKMFQKYISQVLGVVCVLVSWRSVNGVDLKSATCEVSKIEGDLTLNCSRLNIDIVTGWPEDAKQIDAEMQVLVTLFNNSITNLTELPSLPGTRLAFSFKLNKIVEIEADAFSNLDRLVYLDLSQNLITGDVLRSEIFQGAYNDGQFGNISLETLNLGYNQIHSLDRYLFQYTPNLTRLYLNNNPIEILDYVTVLALASATSLEVLDLSSTDIESIPLDAFQGLTNLRQIDLSGNKFATVPESLRLVSSTLEYLTFNNNPIVELDDDSFVGLDNLRELDIGENRYLEEVKRSTFSPLKNLVVLHLCHNPNLRYISHNAFRGLKNRWTLKEVYLDENNLSELSADLMQWNKLEILGLSGNNWLCNCDLADIVIKHGAGAKFKTEDVPLCAAPRKLIGANITSIPIKDCPSMDPAFSRKSRFFFELRPKHILWSIFGVAMVVFAGMMIGLLVNYLKAIYNKKIRSHPIRYVNINIDNAELH